MAGPSALSTCSRDSRTVGKIQLGMVSLSVGHTCWVKHSNWKDKRRCVCLIPPLSVLGSITACFPLLYSLVGSIKLVRLSQQVIASGRSVTRLRISTSGSTNSWDWLARIVFSWSGEAQWLTEGLFHSRLTYLINSFGGSLYPPTAQQLQILLETLDELDQPFILARGKPPPDCLEVLTRTFDQTGVKGKGILLEWTPQRRILNHPVRQEIIISGISRHRLKTILIGDGDALISWWYK